MKNLRTQNPRTLQNTLLLIVGITVGLLIVVQFRSYDRLESLIERDGRPEDAFHELYALKLANEKLKSDILDLEHQKEQYADQTSAYDTLVAEIEKNELLAGVKPIVGPGIRLTTTAPLARTSMVDLLNELWAAGAEAVSLNGYRITDFSGGLYELNGELTLGGQRIRPSYVLEAIGNPDTLYTILGQPGGLISRLAFEFPKIQTELAKVQQIKM